MSGIKKALLAALAVTLSLSFAGCAALHKGLDVIGKASIASFGAVLKAMPGQAEADSANALWSLTAPDKTARFLWSGDWSQSPRYDAMLEFDAKPFLDAGLDPVRLPETYAYYDGLLALGTDLGADVLAYDGEPTPLAAYGWIVDLRRDAIGYHMDMDHFGVNLGDGNLFEWAKDMAANENDIAFVLDPAPLIAAGVDPDAVEGWAFAKVKVHVDGKQAEVDRFLKTFNLK